MRLRKCSSPCPCKGTGSTASQRPCGIDPDTANGVLQLPFKSGDDLAVVRLRQAPWRWPFGILPRHPHDAMLPTRASLDFILKPPDIQHASSNHPERSGLIIFQHGQHGSVRTPLWKCGQQPSNVLVGSGDPCDLHTIARSPQSPSQWSDPREL